MFHCSHRLLCCIKSRARDFLWKLLSFHTDMISALILWGGVLLRGELRKYAKNSNFKNFESALYSTSGSMLFRLVSCRTTETFFRTTATELSSLWLDSHSYMKSIQPIILRNNSNVLSGKNCNSEPDHVEENTDNSLKTKVQPYHIVKE